MTTDELKFAVQRAYDLSHEAMSLMNELWNQIVDIGVAKVDEDVLGQIREGVLATYEVRDDLNNWLSELTADADEDEAEDESASAPAPASP
jgi:hypothetical protein